MSDTIRYRRGRAVMIFDERTFPKEAIFHLTVWTIAMILYLSFWWIIEGDILVLLLILLWGVPVFVLSIICVIACRPRRLGVLIRLMLVAALTASLFQPGGLRIQLGIRTWLLFHRSTYARHVRENPDTPMNFDFSQALIHGSYVIYDPSRPRVSERNVYHIQGPWFYRTY